MEGRFPVGGTLVPSRVSRGLEKSEPPERMGRAAQRQDFLGLLPEALGESEGGTGPGGVIQAGGDDRARRAVHDREESKGQDETGGGIEFEFARHPGEGTARRGRRVGRSVFEQGRQVTRRFVRGEEMLFLVGVAREIEGGGKPVRKRRQRSPSAERKGSPLLPEPGDFAAQPVGGLVQPIVAQGIFSSEARREGDGRGHGGGGVHAIHAISGLLRACCPFTRRMIR